MNRLQTRKQMPEGEGGGGGGAPAFAYGDAHKDYVTTKGWTSTDAVIESNKNLEALLGADKAGRGVIWPKDDQDADGWKGIHAKLGVPDVAEGYGLTAADGEDAAFAKEFSGWALANKVPKGAAVGMLNSLREFAKKLGESAAAERETQSKADMDALNVEWGAAATANKELSRRFAGELGLDANDMGAIESALGTAKFMRMMHKGGSKLGEQKNVPGEGGGGFGVTQADARARLDQARADRNADKISQADYLAIQDKYGPIANPAKAA